MEFILVKLQDNQHILLEHVPEISCLEKNIFRKTSTLYQRLSEVAILTKRELTLDLVEEALKILMYLQENVLGTNFFLKSGRSRVVI